MGGKLPVAMRRTILVVAAVLAALVVGAGATAAVTMDRPDAQPSEQPTAQSPDSAAVEPGAQASHAPGHGSQSVSVSASGNAQTTPDQVRLRVSVVATGADAPAVRQRLADNVSRMRTALSEAGLDDSQIQTSRYDLRQDRRPPRREGERPRLQYRGEHSFTITVSDTERAGEIIDTAVTNGADTIDDVEFTISEERRRSLRKEALRDAMDNARAQADTLAAASDLTITGVHTVETTERFSRPRRELAAAGGDGGGGTAVDSGPVGVEVQVQVAYNATA